jgi:hypothetical protein
VVRGEGDGREVGGADGVAGTGEEGGVPARAAAKFQEERAGRQQRRALDGERGWIHGEAPGWVAGVEGVPVAALVGHETLRSPAKEWRRSLTIVTASLSEECTTKPSER